VSASTDVMAELMAALEAAGFQSLVLETEGRRLVLRLPASALPAPPPAAPAEEPAPEEPAGPELRSPRVGHFYPRMGRGGTPRFEPGSEISKGEVYGSIEAMHLKYELRAEESGVVAELLADEGEAVEYGQPLVSLRGAEA